MFMISIQQLVHLLLRTAQFALQLFLALLHRMAVEVLLPPSLQFGSNHFGPAQQLQQLLPNQLVQVIDPDHVAGTNRPRQVPIAVCARAAIILLSASGASGAPAGTAVQSITALLTDQQTLEQTRHLSIAQGQTPVLRQALLCQSKGFRTDQGRHSDLDPLSPVDRLLGTATPKAAPLARRSGPLLAGTVLRFAVSSLPLIGWVAQHSQGR